jgi:hypothetical protein
MSSDPTIDAFARVLCWSTRLANGEPAPGPSTHDLEALLADTALVTGFVEVVRLRAIALLDELAAAAAAGEPRPGPTPTDPADVLERVANSGRGEARKAVRRAKVTAAIPELADALATGTITVAHLDAVANVLARLDPDQRQQLTSDGRWLITIATRTTPRELERAITRRLQQRTTDDPIERFERQRRATHLRSWTDPVTGMIHLHAEYDPETGARLLSAIDRETDRQFRDHRPDTCPDDDRAHGHLRAHALAALATGRRSTGPGEAAASSPGGAGPTPPGPTPGDPPPRTPTSPPASPAEVEIIVVIDHDTLVNGLHEHSRIDLSHDIDIPIATLRRWACNAGIYPAVLNTHGTVLDLGRRQRLATREQRHALRVMHPTCIVPGCTVPFDQCEIHHTTPWQHGGTTDLHKMGPVCTRHHHHLHEGGHTLTIHPTTRAITVTAPDGTIRRTPPATEAAA